MKVVFAWYPVANGLHSPDERRYYMESAAKVLHSSDERRYRMESRC
jgi:hypothetical protein